MKRLSNRQRAAFMLAIYTAAVLAAVVAARFLLKSGAHPRCIIYSTSGLYCLSCGATRAVYSLLNFNLWQSLTQNPAPLLLALFVFLLMLHELYNLARGARRPFKLLLPYTYSFVSVLLVFCVLRNLGVLPPL